MPLSSVVSAFLAILFLQSGIDKVVDRRGNPMAERSFREEPARRNGFPCGLP